MKTTANKFFSKGCTLFTSCLLYGENYGKITDCLHNVAKNARLNLNNPFSSTTLSFKDIVSKPQLLLDKVNTLSFDGTKRVVQITHVETSLPPNLQKIFESIDDNSTYIILTSHKSLPINSSTRTFFEKQRKCAVIACYNDDGQELKSLIRNFLTQNQISLEDNILDILAYYTNGERTNIYSELNKLIIYLGEQKFITQEDVIKCCSNNFQLTLDDISLAFASQDIKKFLSLIRTQQNILLIIRSITKYFIRLYQVLTKLENGNTMQSAINSLTPPIFFKHLNSFKSHLKLWKINEIIITLQKLSEIEILYKKGEALLTLRMLRNLALEINKGY